MQGLVPGRIVHYVFSEDIAKYYNLHESDEYPMTITKVKDKENGIVNGQVLGDDFVYFIQDVVYSHQDEPLPNSWHWIERE